MPFRQPQGKPARPSFGLIRWHSSFSLSAGASLRVIKCKSIKRPGSPKLLRLCGDGPQVESLTVFQKSRAIAASCCHRWKKISRHSMVKCYPFCNCSDLDHVAPAAVIHFEHTSTVSSDTRTNTYQFPSHADSDTMTALWETKLAEPNQDPKIHFRGSDPLPPCGHHASLEGTAHVRTVPRKADHTSTAPASALISNATGILTPSTAGPGSGNSCGHSPESKKDQPPLTVPTSLAARPPGHSSLNRRPVGLDGSVLTTLLRCLFLGLIAARSSAAADRLTLSSLVGFLHACPAVMANRFALRNGYGTVEARYHLTAYDCSDPTEVQAYKQHSG